MVAVSKVLQVIFRHEIFIVSLICALCSLWSGIANIPSKLKVPPDSLNVATPPEMNDDVYVWAHISDVHFIDNKTKAAKAFYKFDKEVLPVVNPNLIVISGDIVDSRGSSHPTQQKSSQWKLYKSAVSNSKFHSKYLDFAGNHDFYSTSTGKYGPLYSVSGDSFYKPFWTHHIEEVNKTLIIMNTAVNGTYWHNILGEQRSVDSVLQVIDEERKRIDGKSVIAFGHHPLGNLAQRHMERSILSKFSDSGLSYYLCGHLHIQVFSRRPEGILELAVAALRDGEYRVLVFDNDVLAFSDCNINEWPVGVLTFPKPSRFMVQDEPFATIYNANQIRCVAYAPSGISSVEATVDGAKACTLQPVNGTDGLYSCPWDYGIAKKRSLGSHKIEIVIKDNDGNTKKISEKFSFDGKLPKFTGILVWAVLVRVPEILFGFWLYFSLLFPVLVVGSRIHKVVMMRWANNPSKGNSVGEKAAKVIGPVAVSWIDAVNTGQASPSDYFEGEKLSIPQKIFAIATWGIQSCLIEFSKMSTVDFIFLVVMYVINHACPLLVLVRDEDTSVIFSWGTYSSMFIQNEMALFLSLICTFFTLLPFATLLSSLAGGADKAEGGGQKRSLTHFERFLVVIEVASWVGEILFVCVLMDRNALITSPLTSWIVLCIGYLVYKLLELYRPRGSKKGESNEDGDEEKNIEMDAAGEE